MAMWCHQWWRCYEDDDHDDNDDSNTQKCHRQKWSSCKARKRQIKITPTHLFEQLGKYPILLNSYSSIHFECLSIFLFRSSWILCWASAFLLSFIVRCDFNSFPCNKQKTSLKQEKCINVYIICSVSMQLLRIQIQCILCGNYAIKYFWTQKKEHQRNLIIALNYVIYRHWNGVCSQSSSRFWSRAFISSDSYKSSGVENCPILNKPTYIFTTTADLSNLLYVFLFFHVELMHGFMHSHIQNGISTVAEREI